MAVDGACSQAGAHAMAALEMTAEQAGGELGDDDRQAITTQLRQLAAHPKVAGALPAVRDGGLLLAGPPPDPRSPGSILAGSTTGLWRHAPERRRLD